MMCSYLVMNGVTRINCCVHSRRSIVLFQRRILMYSTPFDTVTQHGSLKLASLLDRHHGSVWTQAYRDNITICKGYRCSTHGRNGCYLSATNGWRDTFSGRRQAEFSASPSLESTRGCGGIGRRASFRFKSES